jgi:hypothetical protein
VRGHDLRNDVLPRSRRGLLLEVLDLLHRQLLAARLVDRQPVVLGDDIRRPDPRGVAVLRTRRILVLEVVDGGLLIELGDGDDAQARVLLRLFLVEDLVGEVVWAADDGVRVERPKLANADGPAKSDLGCLKASCLLVSLQLDGLEDVRWQL